MFSINVTQNLHEVFFRIISFDKEKIHVLENEMANKKCLSLQEEELFGLKKLDSFRIYMTRHRKATRRRMRLAGAYYQQFCAFFFYVYAKEVQVEDILCLLHPFSSVTFLKRDKSLKIRAKIYL